MLKQYNHLMLAALVVADACAVALAWLASYWIRFYAGWLPIDPEKGIPTLADKFLPALPLVVAAHLIIFARLRLYRPRREHTILSETRDIVKAFFVALVAVVGIDYLMPESNKISRLFLVTYAVFATTLFALFRGVVRVLLRLARGHGFNRRSAAIVGAGRSAQLLVRALRRNKWTGYEVAYLIDDARPGRESVLELPVCGPLSAIPTLLRERPVDAVFIALPQDQAQHTNAVLRQLETSFADVRVVPEIDPEFALRPQVSELDGIAILSLRQTPLIGSNAMLKRAFDLAIGSICLMIAGLPMLIIAIATRLDSRGPILYRQRRVGLDGREFEMLKFRTMRPDAERGVPVWSQAADDRRTRVGAFLRRTSLDELPNLINVLRGEMSLVGPRPERPEFIDQFKHEIPRYMLRHKMKAGMTGFAQMRGYRGATSLKKRIQHDVHYIRHWSLWLDVRIFFQTLVGVWFSRHEA